MPKPFGYQKSSVEGGVSEGKGCQNNAFIRQCHLGIALALGAGDGDLEKIVKDARKIDHLVHDRLDDGDADLAIAQGRVDNAWQYFASIPKRKQKKSSWPKNNART